MSLATPKPPAHTIPISTGRLLRFLSWILSMAAPKWIARYPTSLSGTLWPVAFSITYAACLHCANTSGYSLFICASRGLYTYSSFSILIIAGCKSIIRPYISSSSCLISHASVASNTPISLSMISSSFSAPSSSSSSILYRFCLEPFI